MAKERMITRTVKVTKANALCIATEDYSTFEKQFTLTGEDYTVKSALDYLKENEETGGIIIASVLALYTDDLLYGMREKDFIFWAQLLDPETRKPY